MLVVVAVCTTIGVLLVLLMCTTPPIVPNRSNDVALVPKSKSFSIRHFMSPFQKNFVLWRKRGAKRV